MSTLAEAKSELGHVQRMISDHGKCFLCRLAKGKRCDDLRALVAKQRELEGQIKTWFDPPPDAQQLFGEIEP